MNVEKINDFIDAYSIAIDLSDEHKGILKELIPKLINKYSSQYPSLSVKDDDYNKYPIKPVNGQYSLEDFFLNRLMRNVWNVGTDTQAKGAYVPSRLSVEFNESELKTQLPKELKNLTGDVFNELDKIARKKVLMHEFEHAMQTRFLKGCLDVRFLGKYKKIIEELRKIKNGKYANEINTYEELKQRETGMMVEPYINTGLRYSGNVSGVETYRNVEGFDNLNEIFNETESLEMAEAKTQEYILYDEKNSQNKSFYILKNAESSNWAITNYGNLLKLIVGEKATFEGMYLSPDKFFEMFNNKYNDIFQQEYRNNKSAIENVILQLKKIKDNGESTDSKEYKLKLEGTLAKCFERKIENNLGKDDPMKLFREVNQFKDNTIWNKDPNVLKNFEHAQILTRIEGKIKSEYEKNNTETTRQSFEQIDKTTHPNGVEISATQYVQEFVAPHIPKDGKFLLKGGGEMSYLQFIEEYVLSLPDTRKRGEIKNILEENTKANNGTIEFRGEVIKSIDIVKGINPALLDKSITLPNGVQITAYQYVQEFVAPHIPKDGKFLLKNGIEITAGQFIEEFVLSNPDTNKRGNIKSILEENTKANNGTIEFRGEVIKANDIVKKINPALLDKRITLPNGVIDISSLQPKEQELSKLEKEKINTLTSTKKTTTEIKIENDVKQMEDYSVEELENMLNETLEANKKKEEELQNAIKKRELIEKIRKAQEEGKQLNEQIAQVKSQKKTRDEK